LWQHTGPLTTATRNMHRQQVRLNQGIVRVAASCGEHPAGEGHTSLKCCCCEGDAGASQARGKVQQQTKSLLGQALANIGPLCGVRHSRGVLVHSRATAVHSIENTLPAALMVVDHPHPLACNRHHNLLVEFTINQKKAALENQTFSEWFDRQSKEAANHAACFSCKQPMLRYATRKTATGRDLFASKERSACPSASSQLAAQCFASHMKETECQTSIRHAGQRTAARGDKL